MTIATTSFGFFGAAPNRLTAIRIKARIFLMTI